jgi:hypothetical protein
VSTTISALIGGSKGVSIPIKPLISLLKAFL